MTNDYTSKDVLASLKKVIEEEPLSQTAKRFTWEYRRQRFRESILANNGDLSNFLSWPTTQESIFAGYTPYAHAEWEHLYDNRYRLACTDPIIGNPHRSGVPLSPSGNSGTYIRQAVVAALAERLTGLKPYEWGPVFEFGGGYGALRVVLQRLGLKAPHAIFDFPELSIIQHWYLRQLEIYGTYHIQTPNNLLGNFMPPWIFFAICSLDEADEDTRKRVLDAAVAKHYIIWTTPAIMEHNGEDPDWFAKYFMDNHGVRTIKTRIYGGNPNQQIIYADIEAGYQSHYSQRALEEDGLL